MINHCENCLSELNANTCVTDLDARPSPGDISICYRCNMLSVFTDTLGLRPATIDEGLEAIHLCGPGLALALVVIKEFWARHPIPNTN